MMEFEARRIRRNKIIWVIVLAVILPVITYVIGVSVLQSLLIAAAVVTIGGFLALLPVGEDFTWERRDDRAADGARREISRLSWTLGGHENRVGEAPVRRLRELALRRLAWRGITLTDQDGVAAAEKLLGAPVVAVITTELGPPPRYDLFIRCVAAVEKLETAPAADPRSSVHLPPGADSATDRFPSPTTNPAGVSSS